MISIIIWWAVILCIGIGFLPLSNRLFRKFRDGGWLFSKVIGIFIAGSVFWTLNVTHVLSFTQTHALIIVAGCICLNVLYFILVLRKHPSFEEISWRLVIFEEVLFLGVFLLWVWMIGFKPGAYGTEKFMDYSFLTSMMRSEWMPFADPWYSGSSINYYYGGQYMTAFIIRISGVTTGTGYNLMRATETAFSFVLPISLVFQLMYDRLKMKASLSRTRFSLAAGLIAGFAVAFCGNFHYVIYGIILPIYNKITGAIGNYSYWFPNSTRYIGYNPDTADKTIHEFPSYSSVLGDLHAHYLNIMFVLTVAAIVYAWARLQEEKKPADNPGNGQLFKEALFSPHIFMIGLFTGMFRWTNYWDMPIYLVVCGCIVFFINMRTYRRDLLRFFVITALQAVEIAAVGIAACLPFTLNFRMISSKIALTYTHTALYQLLILWGLPVITVILFFIMLIYEYKKGKVPSRKGGFTHLLSYLDISDITVLLFGICAIGLVILPEIIYVKDIYGGEHYRANTMFKLTYQAFILFGIAMGYILIRVIALNKKKARILSCTGLLLLTLTAGYIFQSCYSWFGSIFDGSRRESTDASVFIADSFPYDAGAISWLNDNVEGQPVILEAPGDSYSDYERVSTATGLPTVLGWFVHEWLWRDDTTSLNQRAADIETIYTSDDETEVRSLIEKYNITYIYIGTLERTKYPTLNDTLLQKLGDVVYTDAETTYIMKVQ